MPYTDSHSEPIRLGRRAFVRNGSLVLLAATAAKQPILASESPEVRIGLITDLHYADKPRAGTRYYRETLGKLEEAAGKFAGANLDCVVELGDLIDAADSVELEQRYLKTINREYSQLSPNRHYVLGNHCVDTLTKEEFLAGVERPKSYYSFDLKGFHMVVLDACFRGDGQAYGRRNFKWTDANIPPEELEWLEGDLNATDKPVVVFAHQRLDVTKDHSVKNHERVRQILEASGKVLAVFQGHSHQNDLTEIGGIHYCTLVAMVEGSGVENNGYSVLQATADGTLQLAGYRQQASRQWDRP